MKKIKLLFVAALSMMAWTGMMAQTAAEYEAALASINDGAQYRIYTDVDGTKYYVTITGDLTSIKDKSGVFTFDKMTGGKFEIGGNTAVGIQISSLANMRFTNPPLNGDYANLNPGHFCTTSDNRAEWECQVFFLNSNGKYAIRSCNTAYGTSSWADAGRTYWTYSVAPVAPLYSYSAAYVWKLEESIPSPEQADAYAKVQAWPTYIQNAVGLVTNASQFSSNAKETSEGSLEALLDDEYTTFFHSAWTYAVDADHYLQAELSEATQKFQFYFKKRSQNNNNRPTGIVISASNDGVNFTEVKNIDSGLPTEEDDIDYMSDVVDLGADYKYVRFTITSTNNGATREGNDHVFFTFSEFYILPGIDVVAAITDIYNNRRVYACDLTDEDIAEIRAVDIALKSAISTVNVTYVLYDDSGELIDSKTVVQTPYSDVNIPLSLLTQTGYYDYTPSGTIGETDCTITVVRALKPTVVSDLTQLSDNKAYTITCDRGKLIIKDGYLASTAYSAFADEEPSIFAIISYEGNRYLYSVADGKFVTNTGALAEMPTNGVYDAIQIEAIDGWPVPYFMFYFTVNDYVNYGLNTNGNTPSYEYPRYGIVISDWMDVDEGNMYYMVAESDFDPTEAIAALDARYHSVVKYIVKDTKGNTLFASDPIPVMKYDYIYRLPSEYRRAFYSYNNVDVTIEDLETVVEFTATWNGPFEISTDYANAHWYDMAMRGIWYVTSAIKDDDGAYLTQNANTLGLVEESYHWAFLGNGYEGFKVINKEAGDGKSLGWTHANQANQGIPTVMADGEGYHTWEIVESTSYEVPTGSFCLNVPGTNLYVNQYGGPGGSVKFWESTNNISDPGSAFTIIDIPDEFSEYVASDIVPALDATGYFALTDAAKDAIGFNPAYLANCPFEDYKTMRENLNAIRGDLSNFVLPETGYYILTNKLYSTYMSINPSDANLYCYYYRAAEQVVKLTKMGNDTYTISLMGKYAPTAVVKGEPVTATSEEGAGIYTVSIPTFGYAAFQTDTEDSFSALHCRKEGDIVGWDASEEASQWAVTNATSIKFTIGDAGYATAYLPFPVSVPEDVTAYTGKISGDKLWLANQEGTVPAQTAVVLKGNYGTYEFAITEDATPVENNDLKGTLEPINAVGKYVLTKPEGQPIAFYQASTGTIAAGKAYLDLPSHIKVFYFAEDEATGIETLNPALSNGEGAIYNLAGQRVNKAQKGIYIINGKKVLK